MCRGHSSKPIESGSFSDQHIDAPLGRFWQVSLAWTSVQATQVIKSTNELLSLLQRKHLNIVVSTIVIVIALWRESVSSLHCGERERVATHNWQSQKKESENRVRERVRGKTLCFACFLHCFFIVQLVCISIAYLVLSVPSGSFDWSLLFRFRSSYEYHLIDCCVVVVDSIPRRLFQSSCCVWILNIVVGLSFLYWYRDTFFVGEKYIHIFIHYSKRIVWLVFNTHKRTKGITKS